MENLDYKLKEVATFLNKEYGLNLTASKLTGFFAYHGISRKAKSSADLIHAYLLKAKKFEYNFTYQVTEHNNFMFKSYDNMLVTTSLYSLDETINYMERIVKSYKDGKLKPED